MEANTVHAITVKDALAFPEVAYVTATGDLWWELRRCHQGLIRRNLVRAKWKDWKRAMLHAIDGCAMLTGRHYYRKDVKSDDTLTQTVVSSEALLHLYAAQHLACRNDEVKGAYLQLVSEYCKRSFSCLH